MRGGGSGGDCGLGVALPSGAGYPWASLPPRLSPLTPRCGTYTSGGHPPAPRLPMASPWLPLRSPREAARPRLPFGATPTPGGLLLAVDRGGDASWHRGGRPDLGPEDRRLLGGGAHWTGGHRLDRADSAPTGATLGAAGLQRDGRLPPLHPRESMEGVRCRRVIWRRGSRHRDGRCNFGWGRPKLRRIGPEFIARGRLGSRSNARQFHCQSAGGGAPIRPPPGRGRKGRPTPNAPAVFPPGSTIRGAPDRWPSLPFPWRQLRRARRWCWSWRRRSRWSAGAGNAEHLAGERHARDRAR